MRRLEQFWFVREPAARYYLGGMAMIVVFPELNSSVIRPTNWTFLLKGPKNGSNSR
jgi:hypothetical protein